MAMNIEPNPDTLAAMLIHPATRDRLRLVLANSPADPECIIDESGELGHVCVNRYGVPIIPTRHGSCTVHGERCWIDRVARRRHPLRWVSYALRNRLADLIEPSYPEARA